MRLRRPRPSSLGAWLLAVLAYLPALASTPGRMPADTKLYLYLNPGRLIADAPFTWDTRQFGGWVPHQTIAYLWPSGPWFWLFDRLGVPDWVAHRLWIGTILFLGGLGVRWAARQLGLSRTAAAVAGLVYQLCPYVLPYVSRTSVMLLPWAGVGWLVGLTVRACGRTRWRDAALFALVVLTVGAVNATATMLIAPAPILWLVHAAWQRTITWRTALVTAAKLGGLSLLVSLWWIVMLVVQGRHGADVLAFSETLEAVSNTSTSPEVLRGLGYWLLYVRDPYAFTTTAAIPYMASGVVILAGYAILVLALAGLALVRWSQRRFAALLVFVGLVLAVGVHPIDEPSWLMAPLKGSALGLALRSSTRALPVFELGVALGVGALVAGVAQRWRGARSRPLALATRWAVPALVCLLALVNLPALRHRQLVDPALERDQDVPASWDAAVTALDAGSTEQRVLQLPGSEFGAFRWGYTVDPPLPGLTDKPLVTRDLLPLGSPGVMDLLYALDDRFQKGTVDPGSIAAAARFLGVDTIWVANDLAYDRFRTPHPELVSAMFGADVPGLGAPTAYGDPRPVASVIPMVDEHLLADSAIGTPLADVELVPVKDPVPIVRASDDVVVLAGSGEGMLDASAAGLLDGDEAVIYAADLDDRIRTELPPGTPVIVTDSNRDRASHWRGSQDVSGFTESAGPDTDVGRPNDMDQRLEVFPDATGAEHQTTATLEGGLEVEASAYGEPFAYRAEDRAAMAVDGDPSTAWVVADRGDPIGQWIRVSSTDGRLVLLQPQPGIPTRRISRVLVQAEGGDAVTVELGDESTTAPGQVVDVPAGVPVTITIDAVVDVDGADSGRTAVGFAEIGPVAREVVHVPADAWAAVREGTPLAIVLTRDRTDPLNRWRSDPEPTLVRDVDLPVARELVPAVTLRLDARASDELVERWAGRTGTPVADRRLTGARSAVGAAAVDGDPTTAWTTPFGRAVGARLTIPVADGDVSTLTITQPVDPVHSPVARLRVQVGALDTEVDVPAPDAGDRSTITVPRTAVRTGDALTLTITAVDARWTTDRRYAEQVVVPSSIADVEGIPVAAPGAATLPECRDDLVAVDGVGLPLRIDAAALDTLRAGGAATVPTCDGAAISLASGRHVITSVDGRTTGVDVDRILLDGGAVAAGAAGIATPAPTVTVERTRTTRTATVSACPDGCWLILGEGYNDGWSASESGDGLGEPTQLSGGFNGWWLAPSEATRTIRMSWTPQEGLDIALLLAALGVLACVVLAIVDRRVREPLPAFDAPLPARHGREHPRAAVAAAVALVAGAALVVDLPWTAVAAVAAAVALALRRTRWLAWAGAVLAGGIGVIVAHREITHRYFVDATWPGHFEDVHRAGMFVVVLVLAGTLSDEPDTAGDTTAAGAG